MVKYKVLKKFYDLNEAEIREVGQEVDYTVKRATEIEKVLKEKGFEDKFIERIAEDKKDSGE